MRKLAIGGIRARVRVGQTGGLILAVLALAVVLWNLSPFFASVQNLFGIGRNSAEVGIMAIGLTVVLITGNVDLSVASIYNAGGVISALLLVNGHSSLVAICSGVAAGVAVGVINGVLVAYAGLDSFMVTLGTMTALTGGLLILTGGAAVTIPSSSNTEGFSRLAMSLTSGLNMEFVIFLVIALVIGTFLKRTRVGIHIYACGGDRDAARISGIRVKPLMVCAFVISGALSAFAGQLALSFVGSMQASTGLGLEFTVFAAAVVGGASLTGGRGSILGATVGALFFSLLRNGFVLLGVSPFAEEVSVGLLILAAIGLDRYLIGLEGRPGSRPQRDTQAAEQTALEPER